MSSHPVKALCLDVGDVLVDINIAPGIDYLGWTDDDQLSARIHALGQWEIYDAFERGHILEAQFLRQLRSHLGVGLPDTELVKFWNASIGKMVPGVEHVVSDVIDRLPVYALTNTNPIHYDYFVGNMPIFTKLKRVIASFHVGYRKPEAQLFASVASLIGQAPEDILFIDDLPTNVNGAKNFGYQAELCNRSSARLREILVQYVVL